MRENRTTCVTSEIEIETDGEGESESERERGNTHGGSDISGQGDNQNDAAYPL